jgi:hypothetical protein
MRTIRLDFKDTRTGVTRRIDLTDVDHSGLFFRRSIEYACEMLTKFTPYVVTVEWRLS